MHHASLHATERRLITLFVGGAFLFLIIFESIFLAGRIILENKFLKEDFEKGVSRIISRISDGQKPPMQNREGPGGPRENFGIGFIIVDNSGAVVENRLGGMLEDENLETILSSIPTDYDITQANESFYSKKVAHPSRPNLDVIIIQAGGYHFDDILRDILRFLMLDIIILVPFWFLGRYFVREILAPVGENMDTMSHFVHDAGHELKTPLAIISGNLQLLRDTPKKDETLIVESIDTISAMAEALDGLIELSNISHPDTSHTLDLRKEIEHITEIYSHAIAEKNITLDIKLSKDTKIHMESSHFALMFTNLLKNAITYNKPGGNITISSTRDTLTIKDTGIGIDTPHLKKIFERFYRVDRSGQYHGSGIGLALVDRIVRLYDFDIAIDSTLGEGTACILTIK